MGDCYASIKSLKSELIKSIEEGSVNAFIGCMSVLGNNLHRFEELGDIRTQSQKDDKDVALLTQIWNERDEILPLIPVYEKAFYFFKETSFINDSFKNNIKNYKTANISFGVITGYRRDIMKAMKYYDERFNLLKYLQEKNREKNVSNAQFLTTECANFDEIFEYVMLKNDSVKLIWQRDFDQMKAAVDNNDYTQIMRRYFDFLKSRENMMLLPSFEKCKEIEQFKAFYDEEESLYQRLTNDLFHKAQVNTEKADKLKELTNYVNNFRRNTRADFQPLDNFSNCYNTILFEENKQDPDIIALKQEIEAGTQEKADREAAEKAASQAQSLLTSINTALSNNSATNKAKCQSLYATYHAFPCGTLCIYDFTEVPEINQAFARFSEVFGEEISMLFDKNAMNDIFKNFTKYATEAYEGIIKSQQSKFERAIKNAEMIIEKTQLQSYLTSQQIADKNYIRLTNIIANKEKMLELLPYYARFQQFKNQTSFVNDALINQVRNNKLSDSDFKSLREKIVKVYPYYSDKFYELEFLEQADRKKLETAGPFIDDTFKRIEEIGDMTYIRIVSEKLNQEFKSKVDRFQQAIDKKSYATILNDIDEYSLNLRDLSLRTFYQ